jgi:hypothetical protein
MMITGKRLGTRVGKNECNINSLRRRLKTVRKALTLVNTKLTNMPHMQNNYVKRLLATHKKQKRWINKNFSGLKYSMKTLQELNRMKKMFKMLRNCRVARCNKDGRYMMYFTRTEVANLKSFLKRDNRKRAALKIRPGKCIPYLTTREYMKFRWWLKSGKRK